VKTGHNTNNTVMDIFKKALKHGRIMSVPFFNLTLPLCEPARDKNMNYSVVVGERCTINVPARDHFKEWHELYEICPGRRRRAQATGHICDEGDGLVLL
jgi:hypothetical protein